MPTLYNTIASIDSVLSELSSSTELNTVITTMTEESFMDYSSEFNVVLVKSFSPQLLKEGDVIAKHYQNKWLVISIEKIIYL